MSGRKLNRWRKSKGTDRLKKEHAIKMLRFMIPTEHCTVRTEKEAEELFDHIRTRGQHDESPRKSLLHASPKIKGRLHRPRSGGLSSKVMDHEDWISKDQFTNWFHETYLIDGREEPECDPATCPWFCGPQVEKDDDADPRCEWMLVLTGRLMQLAQTWSSYTESPHVEDEDISDDINFDGTFIHYGAVKGLCEHMWMAQWRWDRANDFTKFFSDVTEKMWEKEQEHEIAKNGPETLSRGKSSMSREQKKAMPADEAGETSFEKRPTQSFLENTLFAGWDREANHDQANGGLFLPSLKKSFQALFDGVTLEDVSEDIYHHEVSTLMHMIDPHGGTGESAYVHITDLSLFFTQTPFQVQEKISAVARYDLTHTHSGARVDSTADTSSNQHTARHWKCVAKAKVYKDSEWNNKKGQREVLCTLGDGEVVTAIDRKPDPGGKDLSSWTVDADTRIKVRQDSGDGTMIEGWVWVSKGGKKQHRGKDRKDKRQQTIVLVPVKRHPTYAWDWPLFEEHFTEFWTDLRRRKLLHDATGTTASDATACSMVYEDFAQFFMTGGQYPFLRVPDVNLIVGSENIEHVDGEKIKVVQRFGRRVSCRMASRMMRAAHKVRWRHSMHTATTLWDQFDRNQSGWISRDESKSLIGGISSQYGYCFKTSKKLFRRAMKDLREVSTELTLREDLDSMIPRLKKLGLCFEEDDNELTIFDDWNNLLRSIAGLAEVLGVPKSGDIWAKSHQLEKLKSRKNMTRAEKAALKVRENELAELKGERTALIEGIRDSCALLLLISDRRNEKNPQRIVDEKGEGKHKEYKMRWKDGERSSWISATDKIKPLIETWEREQKLTELHNQVRAEELVRKDAFMEWWKKRHWLVKEHAYKLLKLHAVWKQIDGTRDGFKVWKARAVLSVLWNINEDTYKSRNEFNRRFVSWWHDHDEDNTGFISLEQFGNWWVMQSDQVLDRALFDHKTGHRRDWSQTELHYNRDVMDEFGAMLAEVDDADAEEKDQRERDLDKAMKDLDADVRAMDSTIEQRRRQATWGRVKQHLLQTDQAPFGVLSGGTRPPMLKTRLRLFGTVRTDELNALRDDWKDKTGWAKAVHTTLCRVNVRKEKRLLRRSRTTQDANAQDTSGQSIGEMLGDFQVHKHRFCIDTFWVRDARLWITKHLVGTIRDLLKHDLEELVSDFVVYLSFPLVTCD
jgi:hypothetical protein